MEAQKRYKKGHFIEMGLAAGIPAGIPVGLPTDMPKAWFVALAALSKSATPDRVRTNAREQQQIVAPAIRNTKK